MYEVLIMNGQDVDLAKCTRRGTRIESNNLSTSALQAGTGSVLVFANV